MTQSNGAHPETIRVNSARPLVDELLDQVSSLTRQLTAANALAANYQTANAELRAQLAARDTELLQLRAGASQQALLDGELPRTPPFTPNGKRDTLEH